MKSNIAFLCASLLTLAACSCVRLDPVRPESGGDRIAFPTPLVGTAAKADPEKATYPESSSFGVFALYYPDGDFSGWAGTAGAETYIDGAEFKYDKSVGGETQGSGAWVSDPPYFWPKSGKMTFAAWSPYGVRQTCGDSFVYDATGLKIEKFNTGSVGETDLMYADRVYDRTSGSAANGGIDIVFHHAMSALTFRASASSELKAKVAIVKVLLWGFAKEGTFSENVDETHPGTYVSRPGWDIPATAPQYTETDPLTVTGEDVTSYIIPQAVGSEVKARIYYTVQVGSGNPVPAVSETVLLSGAKDTEAAEIGEWEMSTRYIYNLVLGATRITFSVDVNSWGGVTDDLND